MVGCPLEEKGKEKVRKWKFFGEKGHGSRNSSLTQFFHIIY